MWNEECDGEYSVKIGYNLLKGIQQEMRGGSIKWDCSSLMRIHAPPKVKYVLWRICRECVPTRVRLRQHPTL